MLTIITPCKCGKYHNCNKIELLNSSPETLAADLAKMQIQKPDTKVRVYGAGPEALIPLEALKYFKLI